MGEERSRSRGPWERSLDDSQLAVRRAGRADRSALVEVLCRAFDDDPVATYLFPPDRTRRRGLRRFFRLQLSHLFAGHGEVWAEEHDRGAALWVPPPDAGTTPVSTWRDALRLAPVAVDLVAGGRPGPALRLLAEIERSRPRQPHWYLATLGTDPAHQGRGIGSALLRAVLSRVDAMGLPAYLESSKERNVPFYARHGFEVTRTLTAPDGGVTLWLMWREPRHPAR